MNAQEQFWQGDFGDEYTKRNRVEWEARLPFWRQILQVTQARSALEMGCNAGWNLRAIKEADPTVRATGVDVNHEAVSEARADGVDAHMVSIYHAGGLFLNCFDLVFTAGVLIHIPPESLKVAMRNVIGASKRWVLAIEYESEQEEEVTYRGHTARLWKRPFGRLYEEEGLSTVAVSSPEGFDRCRAWLLRKDASVSMHPGDGGHGTAAFL